MSVHGVELCTSVLIRDGKNKQSRKMADVDSEQDSVNGVSNLGSSNLGSSNLGSSNYDNMRVKTTKFGSFANAFQAFVAWTFLLAVVAAFVLLVMMKVSFLADPECVCVASFLFLSVFSSISSH